MFKKGFEFIDFIKRNHITCTFKYEHERGQLKHWIQNLRRRTISVEMNTQKHEYQFSIFLYIFLFIQIYEFFFR